MMHILTPLRAVACVVIVLLMAPMSLAASEPGAISDQTAELLRQVESRRQLAVREMAQLSIPASRQSRIEHQLQQILASLDRTFNSLAVQGQFQAHYAQVQRELEKIQLPDDTARWEVMWAQIKAGARKPHDLEQLSSQFVQRAMAAIAPLQEQLAGDLQEQVQETLHEQFALAQEELRSPYQQLVARSFPVWKGIALPAAPLPDAPASSSDGEVSMPMVGTMAGVALLVLHRLMRRITRRITLKISGKLVTRFIPIVGALLIVLDIWDYAAARTDLEKQFRETFIAEYKHQFTPAAMWTAGDAPGHSMRDGIEASYRELLGRWDEHCAGEARRVLDAARIYSISPHVDAYLKQQQARGRHTDEVLEDLHLVWDTFEELSAEAPIDQLLDMIAAAQDRDELRVLARRAGPPLIHEYHRHGRDLLRAARTIGGEPLAGMLRSGGDWRSAARQFERYGASLSDPARRGLLIALDAGVQPDAAVPEAVLQNIARHEPLFRHLAGAGADERLIRLFASEAVLEVVSRGHEIDPQITLALHRHWDPLVWQRYSRSRSGAELQHLYETAAYRRDERRQPLEEFAIELARRDEISLIRANDGLDGVRLWDAYVTAGAGEHQRRQAERALGLYRRGYPLDALRTPAGLDLAGAFDHLPGMGLVLYGVLAPLGWAAIVGIWVGAAVLGLIPLLMLWRLLRRWRAADRAYAEQIRRRFIIARQLDQPSPALHQSQASYLPPPDPGAA